MAKKNENTLVGKRVLVQIEGGFMMNDGKWHQAIRGTVLDDDNDMLMLGDGGQYRSVLEEPVKVYKRKIVHMQICAKSSYRAAPEIYSYKTRA